MNDQVDEQQVYGDIPDDTIPLSQQYLDATLPDHVKEFLQAQDTVAGDEGTLQGRADR